MVPCVLTAITTGYWALRLMFLPLNGGAESWWPPIMLGASILLMGSGLHVVVHQLRGVWLVLFAGALPLLLCIAVFQRVPPRGVVFALSVAFAMWIIQQLASAMNRRGSMVLVASLILAVSWVPFSINAVRSYLSPSAPVSDSAGLVFSLAPWVLIAMCVLVGSSSMGAEGR